MDEIKLRRIRNIAATPGRPAATCTFLYLLLCGHQRVSHEIEGSHTMKDLTSQRSGSNPKKTSETIEDFGGRKI